MDKATIAAMRRDVKHTNNTFVGRWRHYAEQDKKYNARPLIQWAKMIWLFSCIGFGAVITEHVSSNSLSLEGLLPTIGFSLIVMLVTWIPAFWVIKLVAMLYDLILRSEARLKNPAPPPPRRYRM